METRSAAITSDKGGTRQLLLLMIDAAPKNPGTTQFSEPRALDIAPFNPDYRSMRADRNIDSVASRTCASAGTNISNSGRCDG